MDGEQPRPDANTDESAFSLTVEEAAQRYDAAGHSRTLRAIQKYCGRGDLDCIKQETLYGQRYRITPESVARHLAQIEEVTAAKGRDQSRTDANIPLASLLPMATDEQGANDSEQPRPDAAVRQPESASSESGATTSVIENDELVGGRDTKYVALLERENDFLRDQISRKDHQIEQRDTQIQSMIERDRETNTLIQGLQRLLGLGPGKQADGDAGDNSDRIL